MRPALRIVIDMNLSPTWAGYLASEEFEADHWTELGSATALDEAILAYALAHDAIVLTCDLDFGAILAASGGNAPSVVQVRAEDVSVAAIGTRIVATLRQADDQLRDGALVTVEPNRTRLTVLPLRRDPR